MKKLSAGGEACIGASAASDAGIQPDPLNTALSGRWHKQIDRTDEAPLASAKRRKRALVPSDTFPVDQLSFAQV